jgi:nitrite reductase/ring-hydroxylating ferredoxin subunit
MSSPGPGAEQAGAGTRERDPRRDTQAERGLTRVAVYERVVAASTERVWENVLDWEHLPWLHDGSFSSIACVDSGTWGWRARIGLEPPGPGREILLELVIEPDEPRYVSRTLEGNGAGTEIWTHVQLRGPEETAITVEFWLKDVPPERVDVLGPVFTELYTRLWDEGEDMMVARERALRARAGGPRPAPQPVPLGSLDTVRENLPLAVEYGGRGFRVVLHDGELVAHSVVCPHLLGPLGDARVEEGRVACPWHGYAFDLGTGRECSGRRLRLLPAPHVRVDDEGQVWLAEPRGEG